MTDLHEQMCAAAQRQGLELRAAWLGGVARVDSKSVVDNARLAHEMGLSASALERLTEAEFRAVGPSVGALRLARARLLRLSGRAAEARAVVDAPEWPAAELAVERAWEAACAADTLEGGAANQARLARSGKAFRSPTRLLRLRLWTHATQSTEWLEATPRAASLRRVADGELETDVASLAHVIDRLAQSQVPLEERLHLAGDALERIESVRDVEARLLLWAALARRFVRSRKRDLASVAVARYRAECRTLSGDAVDDVLGLLCDVDASAGDVEGDLPRHARAVPTGLRRAVATARLGAHLTALVVRSRADDRSRAIECAEVVSALGGELRGVIAKVGQVLSFYGFDLPEEAEGALAELVDGAASIPADDVRRVVEGELGASLERAFRVFDPIPFATGTIGQVHAAELHDGRRVAVKVQYPGIRRAIEMDLRALRIAAPIAHAILPRWDVRGIVEELGRQALSECDYRAEAAHQTAFRERLSDEPDISIPAVIESYSTERVLTTELVTAWRFAEFLERASQAERDRAGELITRLVFRTTVAERWFNTDVHPGNFLFTPGRIHLVDFGNVRRWEGDQGRGFRRLVEAVARQDSAALREALCMLRVVRPEDDVDYDFALRLLVEKGRLLRCVLDREPSTFDRRAVIEDLALWTHEHPDVRKLVVPPEYVFAFRSYFGSFALVARLGAKARWAEIVEEVLREHDEGAEGG